MVWCVIVSFARNSSFACVLSVPPDIVAWKNEKRAKEYSGEDDDDYGVSIGVWKDEKRAKQLFHKACRLGDQGTCGL